MDEKEKIGDELQKSEIQVTLKQNANETGKSGGKVSREELLEVLKLVAPGTHLRTAIDNVVKADKGALIVVENEKLAPLLDGGFRVNCRFTPQRLMELSKMDGAIILSNDMKRINSANVLLTPDGLIKTNETGTRHKAAERTAKQIGGIVIAVSERRHEIILFYKNARHVVKYTADLLRKANEQIQILEKHRESFDTFVDGLTHSEMMSYANLNHAASAIQKGILIQKISKDLKRYVVELGSEGTLLRTRLKELIHNVEKESDLVIKDYSMLGLRKSKILLESLSYDELVDIENVKKTLSYEQNARKDSIRGWRILAKTSLLEPDIALIVKGTGSLGKAINSDLNFYKAVLGEEKAKQFFEEIGKLKSVY